MEANRFGSFIKERRRAKNLSREDLAHAVGISANYVNLIERGLKIPSSQVVNAIAREIEVDSGDLFRLTGDGQEITNDKKPLPLLSSRQTFRG